MTLQLGVTVLVQGNAVLIQSASPTIGNVAALPVLLRIAQHIKRLRLQLLQLQKPQLLRRPILTSAWRMVGDLRRRRALRATSMRC